MKTKNHKPRNRREQIARERALAALSAMRRENLSLAAAAKAVNTDPETVHRYVGSALVRESPRGRYRARAYDRLPRDVNFFTGERVVPITVHSSRTASWLGEFMNDVRKYHATGDESLLARYRGKRFRSGKQTYEFVTDSKTLQEFGNVGLRGEGLYRAIHGVAA
jgi:hypothetical protein